MIDLGHGEGKVSLTAELGHHQSAEQLMGLPASSASERRYTLEVLTEALAWAPAGTSERLSIGLVAMFTEAKAVADFVGRWRPGSAPAKITRTGQRAPAREVAMGHRVYMGVPTVVESAAEETPFAALFEDDGKVGYFYGMDRRLGERAVLDSVYVYNVGWVLDHPAPDLDVHEPCEVEIVWSSDQQRAALLINGRPHAAFDFGAKRAYCRENFPAGSSWSAAGHAWDDQAVDFLAVVREQRQRPGAA